MHPRAAEVLSIIERHFMRLERFGELMAEFPSPIESDRLGERERSLHSLSVALCQSNPATFEFRAPTRSIVGRALDMAECNFYRLLRHACDQVLDGESALLLRRQATERLQEVIYTKIVEEVLSDIVSDSTVETKIRERSVYSLSQIWDRRLTYRTREFFPLLRAALRARANIDVRGGTLLGTEEMFALFREGCDPEFVEFFTRPDPDEDEVLAFREFLFGTSVESLRELENQMQQAGANLVRLGHSETAQEVDEGTVLYEFFRTRFLQATARRLAGLPGPKRTAEGYVMIAFLGQRTLDPSPSPSPE